MNEIVVLLSNKGKPMYPLCKEASDRCLCISSTRVTLPNIDQSPGMNANSAVDSQNYVITLHIVG